MASSAVMLLFLALAAVAAAPSTPAPAASAPPAPAPASTVSQLIVSPDFAKSPIDAFVLVNGDDSAVGQYVAVWPSGAYHVRIDGHVMLTCKVDGHGIAVWCKVTSESPANKGFGQAALELRPTFKLKPAAGPDGAVDALMNIAVEFRAPDPDFDLSHMTFRGNPLAMRAVTMLNHPQWIQAPGFDDVAAAYPASAGTSEGYAVAHCQVLHSGVLSNCGIVREIPVKLGFRKAALSLMPRFQVAPAIANTRQSAPLWVDIPIRFSPPAEQAERKVTAPAWLSGFDPLTALKVYPPEAAAKGVTSGRGVARCQVAADGAMAACAPEPGEPDGLGFSEAAVKLAATMRMNLWSNAAGPVEGGVVRIGIKLNLDPKK